MDRRGKRGEQKQKSRRGNSTALECDLQHDSSDKEDTAVCPSCGILSRI